MILDRKTGVRNRNDSQNVMALTSGTGLAFALLSPWGSNIWVFSPLAFSVAIAGAEVVISGSPSASVLSFTIAE